MPITFVLTSDHEQLQVNLLQQHLPPAVLRGYRQLLPTPCRIGQSATEPKLSCHLRQAAEHRPAALGARAPVQRSSSLWPEPVPFARVALLDGARDGNNHSCARGLFPPVQEVGGQPAERAGRQRNTQANGRLRHFRLRDVAGGFS